MPVKWDDLLEAYDFVSFEGPVEHRAWLSRASGKIYWDFGEESFDEEDDDEGEESGDADDHESAGPAADDDSEKLPRDIEDEEKYLPIPGKRDLDLGSRLVFRFAGEVLPDDYNEVRRIFDRRGAYSKFKAVLTRRQALDKWYAYEQKATEEALREWCEENGIEIEEPKRKPDAPMAKAPKPKKPSMG
jgi:hypothetical protein